MNHVNPSGGSPSTYESGESLPQEPVGGRCVYASEISVNARETYEANFGREGLSGDILDDYAQQLPPFDMLTAGVLLRSPRLC